MNIPSPPLLHDTLYAAIACHQLGAQVFTAFEIVEPAEPFVVIRQDPSRHTCLVWNVSSGARTLGIYAGMSILMIQKKWPHVKIMTRRKDLEEETMNTIREHLFTYTPSVHIDPLGRALLDLAHTPTSRTQTPVNLISQIQKSLCQATRLTEVAIGLSSSILIAHILAQSARPSRTMICPLGHEDAFLTSVTCDQVPHISPTCRAILSQLGILHLHQLRTLSRNALIRRCGPEGEKLYALCRGVFVPPSPHKQECITVESMVSKDNNDTCALRILLKLTVDKFCHQIRIHKSLISRLTLCIVYADMHRTQRSCKFTPATSDCATIEHRAHMLFTTLYTRRVSLRSLYLQSLPETGESMQQNLFDSAHTHKVNQVATSVTKAREVFDFDCIKSGVHIVARQRDHQ